MKLLIIEDDDFKYERVISLIQLLYKQIEHTRKDNVRDAIIYVNNNTVDKIILDMSLPTNALKSGEGSPQPMPMGGVEILLELRRKGLSDLPVVILTQYPDFEIDGENIGITDASDKIKTTYGLTNINGVYYEDHSKEWEKEIVKFLEMNL